MTTTADLRAIVEALPGGDGLRREDLPTAPKAMLATLTHERFSRDGWLFERKLDGVRCLAICDGASVRLSSRTGQRLTNTYPELVDALAGHGEGGLVLDGEVVAFEHGRTSFHRLQGRMQISDPDAARRTGIAVYYYIFDILHAGGYDVRPLPVRVRKRLLRQVVPYGDPLRFTVHRNRDGEAAFEQACRWGWEGVIAKRADSRYVPTRSADWLKFRCDSQQELVICGYTPPKGSRIAFGALLLGYYDGPALRYAGMVGTGFDTATLRDLHARLQSLEQDRPAVTGTGLPRRAHWVKPALVAQVGFAEWTSDGKLRHPRYLGLRTDKRPRDVVREDPA